MADQAVVHIGENSPEQVAFKLMLGIAEYEKKSVYGHGLFAIADKEWLLNTYSECLHAVHAPHLRAKK